MMRFIEIRVIPGWRSHCRNLSSHVYSLHSLAHSSLVAHASASDAPIDFLHKLASNQQVRKQKIGDMAIEQDETVKDALSSITCMDLNSLSPSHLSTLLWSICRLGLNASSDESVLWSCRAIASHTCATYPNLLRDQHGDQDASPSELTFLVWAMSRMKTLVSPPASFASWFKSVVGVISLHAHELRPCDITSLITSLVIAKEPVSPLLCNLLALCCISKLDEMTPSQLSAVISGLGKLRAPIQWKVLIVILDHYRSILPRVTSPEEVSSVVFALTGLCYPNLDMLKKRRKNLLQDLARHSLTLIPLCTPRQLVLLVSGFTRLGFYPGVDWMRLHRQCCLDKKLDFDENTRNRVRAAYQSLLLT